VTQPTDAVRAQSARRVAELRLAQKTQHMRHAQAVAESNTAAQNYQTLKDNRFKPGGYRRVVTELGYTGASLRIATPYPESPNCETVYALWFDGDGNRVTTPDSDLYERAGNAAIAEICSEENLQNLASALAAAEAELRAACDSVTQANEALAAAEAELRAAENDPIGESGEVHHADVVSGVTPIRAA